MDDVGRIEPAAVGNGGSEVGYLEGCCHDFALTDGYGNDVDCFPSFGLECLVVELVVGNESALLVGDINAQWITVAHGNHIVLPLLECILDCRIPTAVIENIHECAAEVAVA